MTNPNLRAVLERLVKTDDGCSAAEWSDAIAAARAALAQPEPEPPADGEVAEFVARLKRYAEEGTPLRLMPSIVARAADLLERLAPQPVPEGPTDEEIMALMPQQMHEDLAAAARAMAGFDSPKAAMGAIRNILNCHAVDHARAVLARWGR
jgi:hypothetical protein